jgi:hypothetical protein
MEAEKRYRGPRLPVVCAECEDELDLSRSGHQFCTNRLCKDGFDVRPDWRFMPLPNLLTKSKSYNERACACNVAYETLIPQTWAVQVK